MTFDQLASLSVLVAVISGLIWTKLRADVVALAGAATLLGLGVVRPVEAQAAFASPALVTLASLFVMIYALELTGVLDALIELAIGLCTKLGQFGLWLVIALCGSASAFLNNTPIVVLSAPVVDEAARSIGVSPRKFLIPLSYATVLGGCCTLIGTSTNLLVNDMARNAGQPAFGLFDIAPVGLLVAAAGAVYLITVAPKLLSEERGQQPKPLPTAIEEPSRSRSLSVGKPGIFLERRPLDRLRGAASVIVFLATLTVAAMGLAPIAAASFAGAVFLILIRIITPDQAYGALRPQILVLVAGMIIIGISLEVSGLAAAASLLVAGPAQQLGPMGALIVFYGATMFLTEIMSNAAVAVLLTPLAVALGESLGVNPQPFVVAVMIAASAAFATPFGYQTNLIVYDYGGYSYLDFVRVGLPLNIISWIVACAAIPVFFPF